MLCQSWSNICKFHDLFGEEFESKYENIVHFADGPPGLTEQTQPSGHFSAHKVTKNFHKNNKVV